MEPTISAGVDCDGLPLQPACHLHSSAGTSGTRMGQDAPSGSAAQPRGLRGFLHIPPKRCTRFGGICKNPHCQIFCLREDKIVFAAWFSLKKRLVIDTKLRTI